MFLSSRIPQDVHSKNEWPAALPSNRQWCPRTMHSFSDRLLVISEVGRGQWARCAWRDVSGARDGPVRSPAA